MTNGKTQRQTREQSHENNSQGRGGSTAFFRFGESFFRCGRKLLYTAVVIFLIAVSASAGFTHEIFAASSATSITGVTELRDWNKKRGAVSAILKDNLIIRNSVTLEAEATSWKKELDMDDYYIHILSGGTLTINNKDFLLSGSEKMITVDAGGTLILREGTISGDDGETVISLKTGSTYKKSTNFNLTGNVVRISSDETQESAGPAQPQLLSIAEDSLSLACMEGASLSDLALPQSVKVSYLTADGKTEELSLPINWDTSGINLKAAGVYKLKGTFSEETLKNHALTNPGQVTATLLLAVMKQEDAGTLNVRMISQDSAGNTVIRLEFPMLTSEVTALYLYSSTDGEHFKRESWTRSGTGGSSQTENFLEKCAGKVDPPWQYLEYSSRPGGQFWLQLEIVGSALAGKTNVVLCDSLEEREPGKMKGSGSSGGDGGRGMDGAGADNGFGANAGNSAAGGSSGGSGKAAGGSGGSAGGSGGSAGGKGGTSGSVGGGNSQVGGAPGVGPDGVLLSGDTALEKDASLNDSQKNAGDSASTSENGFEMDPDGEGMLSGAEDEEFGAAGFPEGLEGEYPPAKGENAHKTAGWRMAAAVAAAALILAAAGAIWRMREKKKRR